MRPTTTLNSFLASGTNLPASASARGAVFLPGSPRCTPRSARLCQEAPDQVVHDVTDGLPGLGGVLDVVFAADEVNRLHDPKVRHGAAACPKTRQGKELAPKIGVLARGSA